MTRIARRHVLRGVTALASLPAPALAASEKERELRFMPQIDLVFLDPHFSMTNITRNHAGLVFDQLYGTDASFKAHPQMAEGHTVEDDGRRWRITLRDGLRWHDGPPVLARDCVASTGAGDNATCSAVNCWRSATRSARSMIARSNSA